MSVPDPAHPGEPTPPVRRPASAVPPATAPPAGTPPPAPPTAAMAPVPAPAPVAATPPPVVAPATAQPLYPAGAAVPVAPVVAARPTLDAGRFWAGVAATAVVAALVAVVGVVVFQEILGIDLVVGDLFATGSTTTALVVGAVLAAVAAGAVLHLLVLTTPRPRAFFGWIVGLGTLVVALLPLTWTQDVTAAVATGIVHLVVGIAVWSLLSGVLTWTRRPAVLG
ncbi:hypothetical protein HLB10_04535 [Cellulomonas fimi]|uniref:DUF6069 family protein n=1 Tax=Cellulomonas fimi TaxID=1708 RepID=UPI0014789C1E|nr:DUF6069 family protein [Cellulomonas fimi]NNH06363.1 hypothetical protein [Cellulomonas fimi]